MMNEITPIDIFKEIEVLNLPKDQFIVVGSGILSAKKIRPAYDLDIVATEELFDLCKIKGDWEEQKWTWPVGYIKNGLKKEK